MLLARRLDERAWELYRRRQITFHLSAIGHEAAQVGMAYAIQRGHDWVVPYYRDFALLLAMGLGPRELMLGLMARRAEPSSGGRQMPAHWSLRRAQVVSHSSSIASQTLHAVGIGLAIKLQGEDRVVLTTCGEGATGMGEWYEAVNWAALQKLPVVIVVENNLYAISLRQERQMAVSSVAERASGLGLPGVTVDGTDFLAVYRATRDAVERARLGEGPTLVEAKTYRITPHSSDDDDRTYRTREEVTAHRKRDPLMMAQTMLESQGVLTAKAHTRMDTKAHEIVEDAVRFAEAAPYPQPEEGAYPVYSEDIPVE